jgi:archaemetzincin
MRSIRIQPLGDISIHLLDELAAELARIFRVSCRVETSVIDPHFAFEPARGQYYSTAILERLAAPPPENGTRLLAVTAHDLFVPILTFVFGEAQLAGPAALVSTFRLREEFYGLAANEALLMQRLTKESVHELGHTCGLRHCQDWRCAMASTHAVERLDLKEARFCQSCWLATVSAKP